MSTYKYLDDNGLTYYNSKVQAKLNTKLGTSDTAYRTTSIPYGECDSTSTATVYTATVPGITELRDGVCMWLKNGVVTSASGFTININNLGAKPVYSNMAAATRDTTIWNVNYTMFFVYDSTRVEGGCWILYRGYNSDNNTIGYQIRTNSQSLPMTSITYRYRLLFTSADNNHYVPANNSTSTNATASRTVCQDKINPFGRIFYYSATTSVAANARPGATTLWEQYAIALGYSFNRTGAALTLTSWKPVYVKAAPQSDGSAIIDSTTPYVQDLPTTEDGKIYIFLGVAHSATNIELQLDHPVYWYKDGMIRPYTNAAAGISSVAWGDITGTLSNQTDLNTALGTKANSADLATVATSGSYNDLSDKPDIMTGLTEMSYGESNAWAKFLAAYQAKQIVYCRASSNTNPATGAQGRKAFMAYVDDAENPTNVEFQYVRSVSSKTAAQPVDQVFVYKLTSANGGTWTVQTRDMAPKLAKGTNTTVSYSNGTYTISATQPTVPTKTSDLTNDGSDGTSTYVEANELATVATTGDYDDLTNKPTIPAAQVNSDWSANSGVAQILNKPTLATVATSGAYSDLSGKPTIPTAGTITSGSTGYATGGDVYTAIGNVETILSTLNNGGGAQ